MVALVKRWRKVDKHVQLLGQDLRDAKEEAFVRMVCDGLPLANAFTRAGFETTDNNAPYRLFELKRVQERAAAILEARRTVGVVTLGETTDMLKRVFASALHEGEYSAAHNAAFSLARLYGHVNDRSTLEVIRRPSRDPEAPSEQALASWVESLPVVSGPGFEGSQGFTHEALSPAANSTKVDLAPLPHARAPLLGPEPANPAGGPSLAPSGSLSPPGPASSSPGPAASPASLTPEPCDLPNDFNHLDGPGPEGLLAWDHDIVLSRRHESGKPNDFNGLAGAPSENGAPTAPVTGPPSQRGRSKPLAKQVKRNTPGTPPKQKGAPRKSRRVPGSLGKDIPEIFR